MANTYVDYVGSDGTGTGANAGKEFLFTFPYIKTSHVVVEINQGPAGGVNKWERTTAFTVETSPSTRVVLDSVPNSLWRIRVLRDSDASTGLVDFANGSVLTETELDNSYEHNRYLAEEAEEGVTGGSLVKNTDGQFDADGLRLENLADPDSDDDAVNKGYADNRYVDVAGDTMTGNLDMGANKVTSSTAPSNGNDLTNKTYVDDTFVDAAGDTMTGQLNMGSNKITNLAGPEFNSDAANKNYVDDTITTAFATGSPPPGNQIGTNVIEDNAVTFAKLQNLAKNTVIGSVSLGTNTPKALNMTELRSALNVADGAEANVQSDWNETNAASDAFILNKPTIPTVPTNVSAFTNDAGYTGNAGTVTSVDTGTGLTGGPITTSGTISLAGGGVGTNQLADGSVTSAKLANGSVTSAKISSTDNIQIGGTPTNGTASKFAVVANSSDLVACFENLATNDSGSQVLIRGGTAALYLHDDQNAVDNVNNYGIVVSGGLLRINLINDAGTTSTPLMELNSSGNLRIAGTLQENATF